MFTSWAASFLFSAVLLISSVAADLKPYITTHTDIPTECKTCPRSLCPNVAAYDSYDGDFNVTCWTRGTKIMGDELWLKTELGCYITQYDVTEYSGDYTTDLVYCGPESEIQELTLEPARTKYKSECEYCPEIRCDTIAYLPENVDLTVTCWTEGSVIIDDPIWLKTTNNCYVSQKHLYSKADTTYLDPCGPIPHLEWADHNNENGTSEINKRESTSNADSKAPELLDRAAMYLVNVTVGEEYAYCRACPDDACEAQKLYEFNDEVWLQCLTRNEVDQMRWSLTTDFCYMKSSDFWECPECDFWSFPGCNNFVDSRDVLGEEAE